MNIAINTHANQRILKIINHGSQASGLALRSRRLSWL